METNALRQGMSSETKQNSACPMFVIAEVSVGGLTPTVSLERSIVRNREVACITRQRYLVEGISEMIFLQKSGLGV